MYNQLESPPSARQASHSDHRPNSQSCAPILSDKFENGLMYDVNPYLVLNWYDAQKHNLSKGVGHCWVCVFQWFFRRLIENFFQSNVGHFMRLRTLIKHLSHMYPEPAGCQGGIQDIIHVLSPSYTKDSYVKDMLNYPMVNYPMRILSLQLTHIIHESVSCNPDYWVVRHLISIDSSLKYLKAIFQFLRPKFPKNHYVCWGKLIPPKTNESVP